jgi:putative transport protein
VKLVRAGEEIPSSPGTVLNRGDILRLAGTPSDVERAARAIGYVERATSETDVVFVGLGILLGGLFGALTFMVGDLPLSLTASGGALVMGLVFGWLRSVRPTFGRIPEPALWVFDTIGLAVFIGVVGLGAGPSFVAGLRATGPSLLVVGFVVSVLPHVAALLFGRYVLKMNPVILLGACAGAGTVTAALRAIQDEAGSKLPVLGYTVPYAIGNILLTAWGPVVVLLTR